MAEETTGDVRIWQTKYESALRDIETGNVAEARKVLTILSKEAPQEEIRKLASEQLAQLRPDWLSYAFLGGTLVVIVILVLKYVL